MFKIILKKMIIDLLIALIIGIIAGTITGLIPGIHINLVGAILVSLSLTAFSFVFPIYLVVFIVSMAITHTFVDFIPSIFLGCPDTDTELSVLPGHEMLKQGFGYQAVKLTALGGLIASLVLVLISFLFVSITPKIYNFIKPLIPYILILVSLSLVFSEKNKFQALFVFLLSGFLGFSVLNLELKEPLLPLLTGLFGSSTLILSIKSKTLIPKQKIKEKLKTKILKPILSSVISSPLTIFLPALGSGQIAIIGNQISKINFKTNQNKNNNNNSKTNRKDFLVLLGATNILTMAFSFLSLYIISKARTGAAVAIQDLIGIPSKETFILILFVILFSSILSFFIAIKLGKIFA